MINPIGAMHTTLRAMKHPTDDVKFQLEAKKRHRMPAADDPDDRPPGKKRERGLVA